MPSDAKILREQGREALREYRSKKARARRGVGSRPTHCADCGAPITQPRVSMRVRCQPCTTERDRVRHRKQPSHATLLCTRCGQEMDGGRYNQRKYCATCRSVVYRELNRAYEARLRTRNPNYWIHTGSSCSVRYASCLLCRSTLTLSGSARLCSKDSCRVFQHRIRAREYFRKTHYMAERYWRIADTPEARSLAHDYFQLRQELRRRRHG